MNALSRSSDLQRGRVRVEPEAVAIPIQCTTIRKRKKPLGKREQWVMRMGAEREYTKGDHNKSRPLGLRRPSPSPPFSRALHTPTEPHKDPSHQNALPSRGIPHFVSEYRKVRFRLLSIKDFTMPNSHCGRLDRDPLTARNGYSPVVLRLIRCPEKVP